MDMEIIIRHLSRYDWILTGAVFLMLLAGLSTLFSLSGISSFPYFERQVAWVALGIFFMAAASFLDFRLFKTQGVLIFILYLIAVILLAVLLLLSFKVRGVEAWFRVGSFSFQPVEPAKLILVILLAKFFSKRHIEIYRIQHLIISGIYVAVPFVLVLLEPDIGSAVILAAVWVAVIVFSGMKLRHFLYLLLAAVLAVSLSWNFLLLPYQKARITTFLNPYLDTRGAGYQMAQSMIAVGSGQTWGKGLGFGSQSHLHFLPEAETDFIFAAFAEEWGFAGVLVMLSLIFLIIWRMVLIGMRASDNFSRLYTLGFASLILAQSFIHIAMNMGALPITGITLPFVSYGGSSLITLLIGAGIVQNIKINALREVE